MIFSKWFSKLKIIVLLFHGVTDEKAAVNTGSIGPKTHIPSDEFEQIIRRAADNYHILSLDDAWQGRQGHKPGIVLTFDDGFQDNFDIALPILKNYNAPATIYVTSGFIDRSVYPFEFFLSNVIEKSKEITVNLESKTVVFNTRSLEQKMQIYLHVKRILKHFSHQERQNVLLPLIEKNCSAKISNSYLSKNTLIELSKSSLITIGCHTHYHQALSSLPASEAQHDIEKGKRSIEKWIGKQIYHFSYPYGLSNQRIANTVQHVGLKTAATTKPGVERYGFIDSIYIFRCEIKKLADFHAATRLLEK